AADFMYHLGVSHDDIYLHTLPMFHANGWGGVWAITAAGGTHVCLRKVDPPHILNLFEKHDVNLLCGAPTVINMLVNEPAAKEANITTEPRMGTAGAPPAAALIQKAQEILGLNMIHVYGLTETSPFILYCEWNKALQEKSPTEQATKYGWFYTGDLAVTHPNGYIEIRDRAKDMIISGGENISSTEVESTLFTHPDVRDVGVVAVPDEKWGEVPKAVIVTQAGAEIT